MTPAWFAIWTRSRHEKQVRDQLAKKTDVDVFLPTIGKWSRWKDRKKKIDWPLFPGYVFARFVAVVILSLVAFMLTSLRCVGD